jgi:hypothetical protein
MIHPFIPWRLKFVMGRITTATGRLMKMRGVLITGMQMVMVMVTLSPALKHVLNRRDT